MDQLLLLWLVFGAANLVSFGRTWRGGYRVELLFMNQNVQKNHQIDKSVVFLLEHEQKSMKLLSFF
jgi:hypothetical protein